MATHSSILDLKTPWTEEPGVLQSMGSQRHKGMPKRSPASCRVSADGFWVPGAASDTGVSCYCCSVARSRSTICNPMDCRMPGFRVLHYLPEFAETVGISA